MHVEINLYPGVPPKLDTFTLLLLPARLCLILIKTNSLGGQLLYNWALGIGLAIYTANANKRFWRLTQRNFGADDFYLCTALHDCIQLLTQLFRYQKTRDCTQKLSPAYRAAVAQSSANNCNGTNILSSCVVAASSRHAAVVTLMTPAHETPALEVKPFETL